MVHNGHKKPALAQLMVKLVIRIDLGPEDHIGPGKIELLERVAELGSISAAGRSMGMSYRRAWDLIDQINRKFEKPVVAAHTGGKAGGGTKLTKFGEDLVRNYRAIAEKALRSSKANMDAINRSLRKG